MVHHLDACITVHVQVAKPVEDVHQGLVEHYVVNFKAMDK